MADELPDADPRCGHTKHMQMIWFWLGWNTERGKYETCSLPRPSQIP